MGAKPDNSLKLLALSGVIGPILFTIVVIILGLLRPDYSHVSEEISKLGEVGALHPILLFSIYDPNHMALVDHVEVANLANYTHIVSTTSGTYSFVFTDSQSSGGTMVNTHWTITRPILSDKSEPTRSIPPIRLLE